MTASSFASIRERLFVAMGLAPALAATGCGALVVLEDDGAGGSGGGTTGMTTTAATTGATTTSTTSTGQTCPPSPDIPLVCVTGGAPCPAAGSPQADAMVRGYLNATCVPSDPEFCWCEVDSLDVVCGFAVDSGACCYAADYTLTELCEGRPFTVEGRARLAPLARRADWRAAVHVDCAGLDRASRAALAEAWATSGRYEHASVASFARVTLELVALGAPRDLVLLAQQAALDEADHAALAFGIASSLADESVGPGRLDIDASTRTDVSSIIEATVREGCIGETVSAVLALAARDGAKDPAIVAALSRIAEDELRHAELAWRTVAWAIEADLPGARDAALAAFTARPEIDEPAGGPPVDPAVGRAFGVLSRAEKGSLSREALREIVEPSRAALFAGQPTGSHPSVAPGTALRSSPGSIIT